MRRSALLFLPSLFGLGLGLACAPKGSGGNGTGGGTGVSRGSGGSAATIAEVETLRSLLSWSLAAGRPGWSDPAPRPGERLRWRVSSMGTPDMVIEMARGEGEPAHWTLSVGAVDAKELPEKATVDLDGAATEATRVEWSPAGSKPRTLAKPADLASVFPRAEPLEEAAFVATGGTFLGNEVVRVAAGEFRARHATLNRGGAVWHFYVARTVPGGVVKLERFAPGAADPSLTMELEDFTKLKRPPPTPLPVPPALATPAPSPCPTPS